MKVYLIAVFIILTTSVFSNLKSIRCGELIFEERRNLNIHVILTGLILFLVIGLRYKVGTDYVTYSRMYYRFVSEGISKLGFFNESGFSLIAIIGSKIYNDYASLFFVSSLITITLIVRTISRSSSMFYYSILIYIFAGSWLSSANGVRQCLASAIIFSGHKYILEKKLFKYVLVIFIASQFHISSWSMIILYFIPKRKLKLHEILGMILGVLLILTMYENIIVKILSFKSSSEAVVELSGYAIKSVNNLRILVSFAPILLYLTLKTEKTKTHEDYFYVNIMFINCMLFVATSSSAYLARFVIYTSIFLPVALPKILNYKNIKQKLLVQYLILVLYFCFWFYQVYIVANLYNYQSIFSR